MKHFRRAGNERGQATVELVLVLPLIFVMMFSIVEFGFALDTRLTVHNAAVEGARFAALGSQPGSATCAANTVGGRVLETSAGALLCSEVAVSYPGASGSAARGDAVVVRVTHTYSTVTPLGEALALLGPFGFPSTIVMNACSVGRLEQAPSPAAARGGAEC